MAVNFNFEKGLHRKGFKRVVGLDEAGRGPLAGPVVACAVMVKPSFKCLRSHLEQIKDSKKLSAKKREEFYKILTEHPNIEWGIGRVSEKVIDKINILEATKLAMLKSIKDLSRKLSPFSCYRHKKEIIDFLILDGRMKLDLPVAQTSIVKADDKIFSCVAAGIIAKVTRDRLMKRYHEKYSLYGFDRHMGYSTALHRKMLKEYGPCRIHRRSFAPIKTCAFRRILVN